VREREAAPPTINLIIEIRGKNLLPAVVTNITISPAIRRYRRYKNEILPY
jgi:hypothetical protein